jgi:hypothetical protein
MKRSMIAMSLWLILSFIVIAPVHAVDEATKDEMLQTRAALAANRSKIVLKNLELNQEETEAFSPVYLEYWEELNEINGRLSDLILDYSDNFRNLTDEKALSMLDEMLDIQKKRIDLRRKYVKKFKKVLTPKRLVQFYQLENKMDAVVMVQLAAEIPLVK